MRSDKGLRLDWETADRITLCTLLDARENIQYELYEHHENIRHMHADDVVYFENLVLAINAVLGYYGES